LKNQKTSRFIDYALGIRFVGEATAKTLANAVNHLLDLRNMSEEDLMKLEDIGPKVASSIRHFFLVEDNIRMLHELESLGITLQNLHRDLHKGGNLEGLTFLFTGTLPTLKRNDAEEMVEAQGGKMVSSVSAKLHYLVVGEDAGSKLEKAKKISSIKIISEAEFLEMLKK
jgi:DNA ligase (NAD+)